MMDRETRRTGTLRWWRRWVVLGVAGLLLGVATTVGVAWRDASRVKAIPRVVDWSFYRHLPTRDHSYAFALNPMWGAPKHVPYVSVDAWIPPSSSHPHLPGPNLAALKELSEAMEAASWRPPRWTVFPEPPDDPAIRRSTQTMAAGRPFLALRSYTRTTHQKNRSDRTESFGQIELSKDRSVPYLPIFPGFLYDSLLYAAPWWLLLLTPGALKRWNGRRRGGCIGCGYDLAGLAIESGARTCPECGAIDRARCPAPAES